MNLIEKPPVGSFLPLIKQKTLIDTNAFRVNVPILDDSKSWQVSAANSRIEI